MNQQQTTIMWLGIILIALNLVINIGELKSVIFNEPAPSANTKPSGNPATGTSTTQTTPPNTKVA
jgi:hypothetical protein